ncbi:MAG: hypothetical protein Q9M36_06540 [Sulfurovum sp.]|nr:hypothetical protein [Sulfurovum sp.]
MGRGMDIYEITYRDSRSDYRQAGDLMTHYTMVNAGEEPETNYKYFIGADRIGHISE